MADSTMRLIEVDGEKFVIFGDLAKPQVFRKAPTGPFSIFGIGPVRQATPLEAEKALAAWACRCQGSHRGNGSVGCPRERHHHHDERCSPAALSGPPILMGDPR